MTIPRQPTRFGLASCAVFVVAAVLLVLASTLFEHVLAALPLATQRWVGFLTLVVPAAVGVVLALFGLRRQDDHRGAAAVGLVLNALFGLFLMLVLLFAG